MRTLLALLLLLAISACTESDDQSVTRLPKVIGLGTAGFSDSPEPQFHKPIRLAGCDDGSILVADIFNHSIRRVWKDGRVITLAGSPDRKGHLDGPGDVASFDAPHGVAMSSNGVIAVAEAGNHTIRLLTPESSTSDRYDVTTLAGKPGELGMRDGPNDTALFNAPHSVAWTEEGGLFVADIGNARIRYIQAGSVRTVAGGDETGQADGTPGSLTYPMDIALGSDGTLLIADAGTHLVRKWSEDPGLTTLALERELATPHGIATDEDGTIFIAEMNAHCISAIDHQGRMRRVFGTGEAGSTITQLNRPAAVLMHQGDLWIADLDNHQIKIVSDLAE